MTDQSNKQAEPAGDAQSREATSGAPSARRRALVRGAAAAVPTILTLHSGAALARSSNLISTVNTLAADAPANCLDTSSPTSSIQNIEGNLYDLGVNPKTEQVNIIPVGEYYKDSNGSTSVDRKTMCEEGGPYFRKQSGFTQVNVPKGGLVSATALQSFVGRINITTI